MENKTKQNDIFATIQADPGFLHVDDTGTEIPDIKVIGVGGGGVNALERLVAQQLKGVSLLAVNTDNASLSASSISAFARLRLFSLSVMELMLTAFSSLPQPEKPSNSAAARAAQISLFIILKAPLRFR